MSRRTGGTENQGNSGSDRMSRLSSQWDCLSERSMNKEAAAKLPLLLYSLCRTEAPSKYKMQLPAGFVASKVISVFVCTYEFLVVLLALVVDSSFRNGGFCTVVKPVPRPGSTAASSAGRHPVRTRDDQIPD